MLGSLQPPLTPALRGLMPSSGPCGYVQANVHTILHPTTTNIHRWISMNCSPTLPCSALPCEFGDLLTGFTVHV